MKKPVNKIAVALWVLAVIVLLGEAASLEELREGMRELAQKGDAIYAVAGSFWNVLRIGLLSAVQLATFGVIIELIDQIRWNALHREK
jgi:hypothetical protein